MESINAENEEQFLRGTQITEISSSPDSPRKDRFGVDSDSDGDISGRTAGKAWSGRNPNIYSLSGGILTQLIKDAEDQLGKARECVEWYKREEQEQLERLESLRKLQELEQRLLQQADNHE